MEGASPTISVTVLNETSAEIDADRWAELVRGVLEREGSKPLPRPPWCSSTTS
ncbi:MAG: hypothetical protein V9G12_06960 [Microthrixaceae bacterium]